MTGNFKMSSNGVLIAQASADDYLMCLENDDVLSTRTK